MDKHMTYEEFEMIEFILFLERSRPKFYQWAACKEQKTDVFFPAQGQSSLMKQAIELCFICAVQEDCNKYAIEEKIEHGVWGGSSADQRRVWIRENVTPENAWKELTQHRLKQ
jgi:WhiB family redox-sensing transcriptional regulator